MKMVTNSKCSQHEQPNKRVNSQCWLTFMLFTLFETKYESDDADVTNWLRHKLTYPRHDYISAGDQNKIHTKTNAASLVLDASI